MPTVQELESALVKADAAGNVADAKALAAAIRQARQSGPAPTAHNSDLAALVSGKAAPRTFMGMPEAQAKSYGLGPVMAGAEFLDAGQHHAMSALSGAGQTVSHGMEWAAGKLGMDGAANWLHNDNAQNDAALKQRESDYQRRVPDSIASYAGATAGEVLPWMYGAGELKALGLVPEVSKGAGILGKAAEYGKKGALLGLGGATIGAAAPVTGEGSYGAQKGQQVAVGAAGSLAGQGIASGAARAASGLKDKLAPEVIALYNKAKAAGVPVHFSQLSDSKFVKTLASALSYLPFSGGAKQAANQQGAFNAAVGRTFGVNDAKALTDDVMKTAKQDMGAAYDRLFGARTVGLDKQAVSDLVKLHQSASRDLESQQAQVVKNQVLRILDEAGPQGAMPGKVYQSLRHDLKEQFGKETPVGRLVSQARAILDQAVARDLGPAEATVLKKLNASYANFGTAKDVLKQVAGASGNVRPAALWPAVRNGSTQEMRNLAKVGQFIKDPIPDSGTAGRLLTTGLVGGSSITGGIGPLAQLMAVGATAGRAMNSPAMARYLAEGATGKTGELVRALERAAKSAPVAVPAVARKKDAQKKD